jgi:LPXTG-motif cell wall-anchored protein
MKIAMRVGSLLVLCLMFLPALAFAAPPEPKGKLVYQDDFSDKTKSKLADNLKATDYSRGFHAPGVYHLIMRESNQTHWELLPGQSYSNFSAQMDVTDASDDFVGNVSGGFVFRAMDSSHLYAVLLDARKQQFAARKLDGQTWTDLIAFKSSTLVRAKDGDNLLRVDGDGDTFTIYLNGETLGTFKDASYKQGGIGMIQSNIDAVGPHHHWDNLVLYTTDAPGATAPAALPTTGGESSAPLALAFGAFALMLLGLWVRQRR